MKRTLSVVVIMALFSFPFAQKMVAHSWDNLFYRCVVPAGGLSSEELIAFIQYGDDLSDMGMSLVAADFNRGQVFEHVQFTVIDGHQVFAAILNSEWQDFMLTAGVKDVWDITEILYFEGTTSSDPGLELVMAVFLQESDLAGSAVMLGGDSAPCVER